MDTQNSGARLLERLIGQEVTVVTFVANYLQIDFDRFKLSYYCWPRLHIGSHVFEVDLSADYEHELRRLLGQTVTNVSTANGIIIELDEAVAIELPASAAPLGGQELLQYHLDPDGDWMVWRESDAPFDGGSGFDG